LRNNLTLSGVQLKASFQFELKNGRNAKAFFNNGSKRNSKNTDVASNQCNSSHSDNRCCFDGVKIGMKNLFTNFPSRELRKVLVMKKASTTLLKAVIYIIIIVLIITISVVIVMSVRGTGTSSGYQSILGGKL
jgi:hypothetical protein